MPMVNLVELDLSYTRFGDADFGVISKGMSSLHSLEKLSLGSTCSSAEGAKHVVGVIRHTPQLSVLKLPLNSFGTKGARSLCCELRRLPSLIELDLQENNISIAGIVSVATSLINLTSMQRLDLGTHMSDVDRRKFVDNYKHLYHPRCYI